MSLGEQPFRVAAMTAGIVLGVATMLGTVGLTATAQFQVADEFDALRATQVEVEVLDPYADLASAVRRLGSMPGVEAVGAIKQSQQQTHDLAMSSLVLNSTDESPRLVGVDPGLLAAVEAKSDGATITALDASLARRVVVVGASVAGPWGLAGQGGRATVYIDGVDFLVVGALDPVPRYPQLNSAVIIPLTTYDAIWSDSGITSLLVRAVPGAAAGIARVAPMAIDPSAPDSYAAIEPPDGQVLRQAVDRELARLGLGLSGLAALVGIAGISSSVAASVQERSAEFGLRRALGATPRQIRSLILVECGVIGSIGGIVGACVGLAAVLLVSGVQGWVPVVSREATIVAPVIGLACGLFAGMVPARRAGRIEPVEALKR